MDPIVVILRASKSPAPSAPVGGEISGDEYDATITALKTAAEQLDAEKVTGPASSVDGRPMLFDSTTGKLAKSGIMRSADASDLDWTTLGAYEVNIALGPQKTPTMSAIQTITFSGTPPDERVFGPVRVYADSGGPYVLTIPSSIDMDNGGTITTVSVPASGSVTLTWERDGANNLVYGVPGSGAGSVALADITDMSANAQSFNAAADYAAMRTALGVAIGTHVQAYSANLDEYAGVNPTTAGLALLDDADAAAQRTTLSAAARAQTGMLPIFIRTVADETLRLIINTPVALTITNITTRSAAGTCTVTGQIDGTPLGGTANAASTTEQSQAHASANAMSVGSDFLLAFTSNSACTGLAVNIHYTWTQA